MIQALCIEKIRNKNNQITHYRVQDKDGKQLVVTSNQVKDAIINKRIDIINLTLTSDNRLIDKEYKPQPKQPKFTTKQKPEPTSLEKFLAKARMLGYEIKDVTTQCKHKVYFMLKQENAILYIPDTVTEISSDDYNIEYYGTLIDITGTLKVSGGKNLKSSSYMFYDCKAQILDLSSFNTSNVTDMSGMFYKCTVQTIDFSSFNTSNVTNMNSMFQRCETKNLDLSSFDTSKVTNMTGMFYDCEAQTINLSSFNTSKVTNMGYMFEGCKAQTLDLSNFNTSKVTNMHSMFCNCKAQNINLSNFNTSNVANMGCMFYACEVQTLDISSFNTSKVAYMSSMFYDCQAQIKTTDIKILKELNGGSQS